MKRQIILFATVAALLALQGCGFHLRGRVTLSESVSPIYVKSTDPSLANVMEDQIKASGNAVAGAEGAGSILTLHSVNYRRDVRTVDERGKVTGYNLYYEVSFDLVGKDGKDLIKNSRVSQTREFNFDPNQVLATEGEETFLREDMEKDVSQQILRQLSVIGKSAPEK
jgi:LPS-assembly lipoprotein